MKSFFSRLYSYLSDKSNALYIENIIASVVCGFLLATLIGIATNKAVYTDLSFVGNSSILFFAAVTIVFAAILLLASVLLKSDRAIVLALLTLSMLFGIAVCFGNIGNIWLGAGIATGALIVSVWAAGKSLSSFGDVLSNRRIVFICVCVLFAVFSVVMSLACIWRYRSFTAHAFDLGIFAQMFEYMKTTGLPYSTCERNNLISHFAVHFSPFFYLLLPGYFIFPSVEYLLCAQAVGVALGVFAVLGIAKALGFSGKVSFCLCVIYTFYPSMSIGTLFDFHENKFLSVCILFTIYFLLKRRFVGFYLCALALCSIKEDSAIYLFAIALFMLLSQKLFKHGAITLVASLLYFVFALEMVKAFGGSGSEFAYRYEGFDLGGGSSVMSIIKTVLLDFGYAVSQIFQKEKIEFILWMFLPVMFAPFMSKRISYLSLITPMLIVNLLSSWHYQYDYGYQYTYGTGALIIVCAMLALKDMPPRLRRTVVTAGVIVSISLTVPLVTDRASGYFNKYYSKKEQFESDAEFLRNAMPNDAFIVADGYLIPIMYKYKNLYTDPYLAAKDGMVDYYVLNCESESAENIDTDKFRLFAQQNEIVIYQKISAKEGE